MANNKEVAAYVMEQLSGLDGVRHIPMMGGYLFYYQNRIFGGIYGGGYLMVKNTPASRSAMPDSVPEPPYEGAKAMLPVTVLEDREKLQAMVVAMYPELPEPKEKKPRKTKKS